MSPRSLRPLALILACALSAAGCGSSQPAFDASANYTAESLAQEFLFRFKGLNIKPKRAPAVPKKAKGTPDKAREERVAGKSQDATKAGPVKTLDDLLDDTAAKARLVKGATPAETLRAMAGVVAKTSSVPEADRKILAERLEGVASAEP